MAGICVEFIRSWRYRFVHILLIKKRTFSDEYKNLFVEIHSIAKCILKINPLIYSAIISNLNSSWELEESVGGARRELIGSISFLLFFSAKRYNQKWSDVSWNWKIKVYAAAKKLLLVNQNNQQKMTIAFNSQTTLAVSSPIPASTLRLFIIYNHYLICHWDSVIWHYALE